MRSTLAMASLGLMILIASDGGVSAILLAGPQGELGSPRIAQGRSIRGGRSTASKGPAQAIQPRGRWLGQDGRDFVGPSSKAQPNDVQDIHIRLEGLPRTDLDQVVVKGHGGDEWRSDGQGAWALHLERGDDRSQADLFLEPTRVETGRGFEILLNFKGGATVGFWIEGGKADPNARMAGAAARAKWVGQDSQDRVGVGPSVGPDGIADCRIELDKLSDKTRIDFVTLTGPHGLIWRSGTNPSGHANLELLPREGNPSRADLLFQPERDIRGATLTIELAYEGGRRDSTTVVAGPFDPRREWPSVSPPRWIPHRIQARWLGQDGKDLTGPGDVHVVLENLPSSRPLAAVALSNGCRAGWSWRGDSRVAYTPDPYALPLEVRRGTDGKSIHLFFSPDRDETDSWLTARLVFDDGRSAFVKFAGGRADLAKKSPPLPPRVVTARPGDRLTELVETSGTIRLSRGTYDLDRPLILPQPVALVGEPGAVLRFSQREDSEPWTAAIKVHAGNTRLEGFAVRFSGPIRWKPEVQFDPAVIGTTDNFDPSNNDPKADIVLSGLDLESPPPRSPDAREEAVALARLVTACGGRVEGCTLRGGMIRFTKGPWVLSNNDYRGTHPGTYAWAVFSSHNSHDLVLRGNRARPLGSSGKTWRFLVQTVSGLNDRVEGNRVEGIGPRDDDTHHENAPEIILTEAYRIHFEGRIARLSSEGRVLQIPPPQGDPARTGDIVAVVSGRAAGRWSRVVQAIDPTTYLVDPPLPEETEAVSIVTGFVNQTYGDNLIDTRDSTIAGNLVLVGNHFDLKVRNNRLVGGCGFKITAAPSEMPVHWGWSHAPCLDIEIRGNTLEDQRHPSLIGVEREGPIKSSRDRVYFTGALRENIVAWSSTNPKGIRGVEEGIAIRLNDVAPLDPNESVIRVEGNQARGAPARLQALGVNLNGKVVTNTLIPLPLTSAGGGGSGSGSGIGASRR